MNTKKIIMALQLFVIQGCIFNGEKGVQPTLCPGGTYEFTRFYEYNSDNKETQRKTIDSNGVSLSEVRSEYDENKFKIKEISINRADINFPDTICATYKYLNDGRQVDQYFCDDVFRLSSTYLDSNGQIQRVVFYSLFNPDLITSELKSIFDRRGRIVEIIEMIGGISVSIVKNTYIGADPQWSESKLFNLESELIRIFKVTEKAELNMRIDELNKDSVLVKWESTTFDAADRKPLKSVSCLAK